MQFQTARLKWRLFHANLLEDATGSAAGYGVRPNFRKTFRADSVEETLFWNDHALSPSPATAANPGRVKRGLMGSSLPPDDGVGPVACAWTGSSWS